MTLPGCASSQLAHHAVFQLVALAAFRTCSLSGRGEPQLVPVLAHPPGLPCGVADYQRIVGNIFGYHRPCADKSKSPYGMTANNSGIGTNGSPLLNQRLQIPAAAVYGAAGVDYVGKHHRR